MRGPTPQARGLQPGEASGLQLEGAVEGYRKRKAYMESHGEGERHPALKWSKYASGGPITNAVFPDKMRLDRTDDRSRQHESAGDRRRVDEKADN